MMMKAAALFVLLAFASGEQAKVTPVQKVIQLLNGMSEKGKLEKQEEEVGFAAYKQFCDDTSAEKNRMIAEANANIEKFSADNAKHSADAAQLGHEIDKHNEDINDWQNAQKKALRVRAQGKADFEAEHLDLEQSITQLGGATDTMKAEAHDVQQTALTQVAANAMIPEVARKALDAFLKQSSDPDEEGLIQMDAPQANAAEFASSGIINLLGKLERKFQDQQMKLEKNEQKDGHAHEMHMQDLQNQIDAGTQAVEEKSEEKAKALQAAADARGNLGDTTATRDSDMKYLSDLTATCQQKSSDFVNRQQLRADEIEAIGKATEILEGGAVSGAAANHLPALMQLKSTSFAQLRASATNPNQIRVAAYLKDQATKLDSRVLSAIAMKVAYDPFKSVKKMVKDLIVKLMTEAGEEAEHKGFCDTELSTNEQTRKGKTQAVEVLHAEIDQLDATVAKLTQEITDLSAAVADLDEAAAQATQIREDEKAKNTATIKDAIGAETATANALEVLREFYAKAGEATSFVQKKNKQPEVFDTSYQGMQAESGGVVGMLEVIQSDFARLNSETSAAETQATNEYNTFMSDTGVDKTSKNKDIEHKTAKKQNFEQAIVEKKQDLDATQQELDAALAYFEKLKPSCINGDTSYEDRVARRKEEIESLQEALRILTGEDEAAFLQK